jgi:uncharacterized protein
MAIKLLMLKKIMVKMILFYQHKAPQHMRDSCLYTPSCSNYMLLAIGKHGALVGAIMGLKRIIRCKPPNGGTDYP